LSDIIYLLDRLEKLLTGSWRIPLSAYLVVGEEDAYEILDQMRAAIPREIKQAERTNQERDRIIAQSKEEAERIVKLAQDDAEKLSEDHEVIKSAKQRAETILERAQHDAQLLKTDADHYAQGVLASLDDQLGALDAQIETVQTIVRNGLATLAQPREEEQAEEHD
jgi:hypothetical protein